MASRKFDGIRSFSQMDTRMSWNVLKAVVPSALHSSAGISSAPGVLQLFISFMAVLTSSTLGGRSRSSSRGFRGICCNASSRPFSSHPAGPVQPRRCHQTSPDGTFPLSLELFRLSL